MFQALQSVRIFRKVRLMNPSGSSSYETCRNVPKTHVLQRGSENGTHQRQHHLQTKIKTKYVDSGWVFSLFSDWILFI